MNTRLPTRRALLLAGAAALGAPAARAATLVPTPAQAEGPYYPRALPADTDPDLTRLPGMAVARGTLVQGARVEIWQADADGIYLHQHDPRLAARDARFQGFGRVTTAADGRYEFITIRPGLYPGRTAHIHMRVDPPSGPRLTTQVYFSDEPGNAQDGLLRRVTDPAQRARLIAQVRATEDGQDLTHDVVLRPA
jgi:protocatechuate 3,4-dioxygenase beta subunit